jgi:tRNA(fMet)-specific endonuclease VapC
MYLLDTTHCIDILNAKTYVVDKIEELGNLNLSTCVIVQAELLYGAFISDRVTENLNDIGEFLRNMIVYDLNHDTAIIYAKLKSAILDHFIPKSKDKRRNTNIGSLGFKDNDLWITAIAIQYDLILVSKDSHIQKLNNIVGLKVESWEII